MAVEVVCAPSGRIHCIGLTTLVKLVVVLSVALSFIGCTTTYRYTVEEARKLPSRPYDLALVPSQISGAVLNVIYQDSARDTTQSGTLITPATDSGKARVIKKLIRFNSDGGRVLQQENRLVGITQKGDSLSVQADSVVFLEFRRANGGHSQLTVERARTLHDSVLAKASHRVSLPKISNWDPLRFDDKGCLLDSESGYLTGKSRRGKDQHIPLSEVVYLQHTEINPYKTLRVITIASLLGILILGPVYKAF